MEFFGEIINNNVMKHRQLSGKGGYFIKLNMHEILDCYENRMSNECQGSCVNSAHADYPVINKKTGRQGMINCKLSVYNDPKKRLAVVSFKSKMIIPPNIELLGDYEPYVPSIDDNKPF